VVDEVSGVEGTSRRTRLLVLVAVLLLAAGLAADRWRLDRERSALLGTVEQAEGTVSASLGSLLSLVDYAGPLLTSADVPAASRRSALVTLSRDAARWEPRIRARQELVDDAVVLPWHDDLRAAREAYASRLTVWADLLATVEQDPEAILGGSDGDVTRTRSRAVDALLAAGADPERVRRALGRGTEVAGAATSGEGAAPLRRWPPT
jgi:hypothetical protein